MELLVADGRIRQSGSYYQAYEPILQPVTASFIVEICRFAVSPGSLQVMILEKCNRGTIMTARARR